MQRVLYELSLRSQSLLKPTNWKIDNFDVIEAWSNSPRSNFWAIQRRERLSSTAEIRVLLALRI